MLKFNEGNILFGGDKSIVDTNDLFVWDNDNEFLGIGTDEPQSQLHIGEVDEEIGSLAQAPIPNNIYVITENENNDTAIGSLFAFVQNDPDFFDIHSLSCVVQTTHSDFIEDGRSVGFVSVNEHAGTGSLPHATGIESLVFNSSSGQIDWARGNTTLIYNPNGGSIDRAFGMYILAGGSPESIGSFYGLAINVDDSVLENPENSFGLMIPNDLKNYIGGSTKIGKGVNSPDPSAQLDVYSTTKGFLPPRMTTEQRDAIENPAEGLIIYNLDEKRPQWFNGDFWIA